MQQSFFIETKILGRPLFLVKILSQLELKEKIILAGPGWAGNCRLVQVIKLTILLSISIRVQDYE